MGLAVMMTAAILLVGGCQSSNDTGSKQARGSAADTSVSQNGTEHTHGDSQKPAPTDVSPLAGRAVIKHYYKAIDSGDYQSAYALWWSGDKGGPNASGKTLEQFKSGFANTRDSQVEVGTPGSIEGAAGSSYVSIPVTVKAALDSGQTQRFTGSYTLRRVNNVDGASWAQKHWHIYSADLQSGK